MEYDQDTNRHGVMADDSRRLCVVMPNNLVEQLTAIAKTKSMTVSNLVRQYCFEGVIKYNG